MPDLEGKSFSLHGISHLATSEKDMRNWKTMLEDAEKWWTLSFHGVSYLATLEINWRVNFGAKLTQSN